MGLRSYRSTFQDILFLFLLSSFFLVFYLGNGSLASWDEAVYACISKEIFQSGNWLNITLDGKSWSDKPPLAFWATAFFYKLFGLNEFSARLFSGLCGVGVVLVTYLFGTRLLNRWVAFLGALVLLSSSHFIRFTRFGMLDAPLTFFLSLALYFFWSGREKNRYLIFSGVAIGLALMTKGFAALLIFPIIWLYCWWADELEVLTRSSYWIGVMVAVAIALPWNLYELFTHRGDFMQNVVIKHLILRTSTPLDGHVGSYYFYIRTLVNKYHPWVLIGIFSAPYFLFKAIKDREREIIFLSVWMFLIFAVITLVRTKLAWYIFPIYPALSLSVGYFLAKMFGEEKVWFVRFMFLVIMALHVPYSHIFHHDYSRDIKGITPLVRQQTPLPKAIYLYNNHEAPATSFYLGLPSEYLDDPSSFSARAVREKEFYCLIYEKDLAPVRAEAARLGLVESGAFGNLKLLKKS